MLQIFVISFLALTTVDSFITRSSKWSRGSPLSMGSVSEEEKKYRRQVEDPTDGADEVKVKRTLWDGTVQDEKWKNPKDIKIFANQTVTRGVDPTGRSKTHESQKNHLVGAFSGEAKKGKGVSFNYDPDKYKDTNAANYRRLRGQTDDLKAEEERKKNEKDEAMRKEKMRIMMLSKEGQLFWTTPEDKIVATSDKFFIDPEVLQVLDDMNHQFIGLKPVKEKMRRYASQMLSHKIREDIGIKAEIPPLHHVFTGNPGTGKTTVAMKMGELYQGMGFIKRGHTVQATRADLVGQYIGHTGPKTREMILKSFGGILFIDEAYGLYKEDSRDYGSEVLELLVKFIDTTKNSDFVLVLAGYRGLMTRMLNANLNLMSRMGNWIDFPDYDDGELLEISVLLAEQYTYHYSDDAKVKFVEFMNLRKEFPYFSNARTVRNAMERARRIAATRVLNDALENGTRYSMEELQTFVPSDFEFMSNEIRNLDRQTMLP